jgi:uncharacterized protein (TIRG00374 family)
VCLAAILRNVEIAQSWNTLIRLKVRWVFLAVAISWASILLRAWRWQRIFPVRSRPGFWRSLQVLAIGNMGNNLLPGRAGDLARCALIGRKVSVAASSEALATLGVEKLVDGLALLGIVLFSMRLLTPPRWVWQLEAASGVVFTGTLLLLLSLGFWAESMGAKIIRVGKNFGVPGLANRIARVLRPFADALREINSGRQVTAIAAATSIVWFMEAALVWTLASSLSVPVTAASAVAVSAVIGLGLMIPAAPAGLGTYEAFGVAAFKLVGIAASKGLAVTLLLHGLVFLANNGLGLLSLGTAGRSFSQLGQGEQVTSTAQTATSS